MLKAKFYSKNYKVFSLIEIISISILINTKFVVHRKVFWNLNIFKYLKTMAIQLKNTIFILLLLLVINCSCFCQTARIDSIKKILTFSQQNEKERLFTLFEMCSQYNSLHPDSLYLYIQGAKRLLVGNKNFADAALVAYYETLFYIKKGRIDTALIIVEKNLADKQVLAVPEVANKFRLSKTGILIRQSKLKEALQNALEILHEAEKSNLPKDQIKAQIQTGWVYMELNQNNDALKWFFIALTTILKEDPALEPSVLNSNIAAVYNNLKKNDSATIYINRAILLATQMQELSYLCNSYYIYADICTDLGNISKAEQLLKKGIEIRKKIGDPFYIIADLAQLGKFYAKVKQYKNGVKTIKEGIKIATENKLNSKLLFLYTTLAENYKAANDLLNYSNTLKLIIELKDTLYSQNSAEAISDLQTKYEVQKKENTIIKQRLDLVTKNYWLYGSMILSFFTLLLIYNLFKNYRKKEKIKMEFMLAEEKRFAQVSIKEAQGNERKRIAADLHDNLGAYAAAISSSVDYLSVTPTAAGEQNILEELKSNAQQIVAQLNDTIWVLTKEELALTAISDRLKVFIQRLLNSYPTVQIDVMEKITIDYLLPPIQAFHLFKILQEGITNALRHSKCTTITICIESDTNWQVIIKDNGNGMAANLDTTFGGNGLQNMKKRSKEAGWLISWQQLHPKGTQLIVAATTN